MKYRYNAINTKPFNNPIVLRICLNAKLHQIQLYKNIIMKNTLKELKLDKEVISTLNQQEFRKSIFK